MENCMKRRDLTSDDREDQENYIERGIISPIISPYKKLKLADSPVQPWGGEVHPVQCSGPQLPARKPSKVLQNHGQLKVSVYMNFGLLTVHVVQCRNLSSSWKSQCDSYVKMSLVPDDSRRTRCKTQVIHDSNSPVYDDKFSFELLEEDLNKRLLVSVWHKDSNSSLNEFLGCMTFGVKHLTKSSKDVSGWYYLLTEDVGRKKHLQVSPRTTTTAVLKPKNNCHVIPVINKDVLGLEPLTVSMFRGKNGYGFSVIDSFPVKVGRVDGASPAEMGGLRQGDCIIKVNGQNVSRSTCVSVAKLVKRSSTKLVLDVQRQKEVSIETLEKSPWKPKSHIYESIHNNYSVDDRNSSDSDEDDTDPCVTVDDAFIEELEGGDLIATSTPLPLLLGGHKTAYNNLAECRKQEAVHRLMSLELDFIDFMHAGMQSYSRPLRHCILGAQQHKTVFQNIEKLVTISEYHMKQMQDNQPSAYSETDDDDSQTSEANYFLTSMGLIYQSKVHMLCQAYEIYARGIADANTVLSELKNNDDFLRFTKNPQLLSGQPSISAFIYRPIQHVKELYQVLQDIFSHTRSDSPDHGTLQQVVDGMQACVNNITNCSSARIQSWSSLTTSSKSKTSSVNSGSMKSQTTSSSTSSSSSSSSSCHKKSVSSSIPNSCSMNTVRSTVDSEVMRIQDRLIFSQNVAVFQLCQEERHLIFRGDCFKWVGRQWTKVHLLLFSDVLLQVEEEQDFLRVLQDPLFLRDICGLEAQRKHATELVLHTCPKSPCTGIPVQQKIVLRAPTTEDKCVWKSLLEQRVFSVRGSLHTYSSSSSGSGNIEDYSTRSSIII